MRIEFGCRKRPESTIVNAVRGRYYEQAARNNEARRAPITKTYSRSYSALNLMVGRLLKDSWKCHPEVAPILRDRRICFIFSMRKQQILRCAQDDTPWSRVFQRPARSPELAQSSCFQQSSGASVRIGLGIHAGSTI